jgi:hypothetical protein
MTGLVIWSVLDIVALIAGLAIHLYWIGSLLIRVAANLEECAELVRTIVGNAKVIGPGSTTSTGPVASSPARSRCSTGWPSPSSPASQQSPPSQRARPRAPAAPACCARWATSKEIWARIAVVSTSAQCSTILPSRTRTMSRPVTS